MSNAPGGGAAAAAAGGAAAGGVAPAANEPMLLSLTFIFDRTLNDVLNGRRHLNLGDDGGAVRKVQRALLSEGYTLRGGADGVFGADTVAAVRIFQRRWRLPQTGVVGDRTIALLDAHLVDKGVIGTAQGVPLIGGAIQRDAARGLDTAEAAATPAACPVASRAERRTACVQPVVIANDDGTAPTRMTSLTLAQRIWEKCCITLSVMGVRVIPRTAFKALDDTGTGTPLTAEEVAALAAVGTGSCIPVIIIEGFAQNGRVNKNNRGGGFTNGSGAANAQIVLVEGAVPAVAAHEIGHAMGAPHDAAVTVMRPTGAFNVANSSNVSAAVCASARTGLLVHGTSGAADCCTQAP